MGPALFPIVIEGAVGFKNQQRICNIAAFPSADGCLHECLNYRCADDEVAWIQFCEVEKLICRFPRQKSGDSHALSLDTFFGASKESIPVAGRDRRSLVFFMVIGLWFLT